ncbi:MAG: divalent cation tolerance protein CutA [Candidatus Aenigmatarchaeota archaeon]
MKIVLTTCPPKNFKKIRDQILNEKLSTCVLEIKLNGSSYWWDGKILKDDKEVLCLFKTSDKLVPKLMKRIKELHPYKVPFIGVLNVEKINEEYLKWLKEVLVIY